jgi:hypothetical protein
MQMNSKDAQALFIALLMLSVFSYFFQDYVGQHGESGYYQNIITCTKDGRFATAESEAGAITDCERYPPLIIWIGKFFLARDYFYQRLMLVLFGFFLPLVLYKITGEPITVWFYFAATNFFFATILGGWFPQALGSMIILSMIFLNWWQRGLALLLAILAHSSSFYVGLFFAGILAAEESGLLSIAFMKIRRLKVLLACSPFWQGNVPQALSTDLLQQGHTSGHLTINTIGAFLIKSTPLPFLYWSTRKLLQRENYALLGFMFLHILAGFFYYSRIYYFAALPMVCGLAWYWKDAGKRMKVLILVMSLLLFAFNVQQMVSLNANC